MSGTVARPKRFESIDPPTLIDDITASAPAVAAPVASQDIQADNARRVLTIALMSLSRRSLTAITNLFSLFLVASVAWLLGSVLPNPTPYQLVGVGGYAAFCLLIDIIRRDRK